MLAIFWLGVYGLFAFVAGVNFVLMRRVRGRARAAGDPEMAILIPARNEAENLRRLLPQLEGLRVYVYDDESEDGTGEIARGLGARVVRPSEALPAGWTGKNRACHALAQVVAEDSAAEWWVFLDADVEVKAGFAGGMAEAIRRYGARSALITGFPEVIPGRGVEPLFLSWVGWSLLAMNPFGLVSLTGTGHNYFANGQVQVWKSTTYTEIWPHEQVRSRVLEDVAIGRLLAREKRRVEVMNLSAVLGVRMYATWRETVDGMSKNSYEIAGKGTFGLVLLFVALALGWMLAGSLWWAGLGLLTLSGVLVALTARAALWPTLLMPVGLLIGAGTLVRSWWWRRTGRTQWKGRVYPPS